MQKTMTRSRLLSATAVAALAAPDFRPGFAIERKDTANLSEEVKAAVDKLGEGFEAYKKKNDQVLAEIKAGREDVVSQEELKKLNDGVDALKADVQKQLDEIFKKANRQGLAGGDPDQARSMKAAREFGELIGKADYSPDDLKAYRADLDHFIRRNEAKATTMSVGSDPSGGYLVTPDVSGRMVQKIYESTPMRQVANVVAIGTDKLEGPIDNGEGDAAWIGETGARAQTDTPQIGMWSIDVHELYAYPMVTQKLLEDAKINVESWLGDKGKSKFARKESTGFIVGTGIQQPRGLWTYDMATTADATRPWGTFQYVVGGHASLLNDPDKIIDLIYELKAGYRQGAGFMGARRTMGAVRKLKDGDGNYLAGLRLSDGVLVENIFGYGFTEGEDVPAIAANAYPLAFGDFAETYTIVDRLGISVIRDNITRPGFVKFLMRKRVGGGAVNFESMKFLKIST